MWSVKPTQLCIQWAMCMHRICSAITAHSRLRVFFEKGGRKSRSSSTLDLDLNNVFTIFGGNKVYIIFLALMFISVFLN